MADNKFTLLVQNKLTTSHLLVFIMSLLLVIFTITELLSVLLACQQDVQKGQLPWILGMTTLGTYRKPIAKL